MLPTDIPSTSGAANSIPTPLVETEAKTPTLQATPNFDGQIDLGTLVQAACGSWDRLIALVNQLTDDRKGQYLRLHYKPIASENLHSHRVTKLGKTWNISFQHKWLEQFRWLSYSAILSGGICRCCILFPEQPVRGSNLETSCRSGVLVLSPYQKPYSKALGKDGVLVCHE